MDDWTAGYVADIGYTYGYYAELNPLRLQMALLNAGLVAPQVHTACELGFGQGVSINVHAAASGVPWHGTDFNPAQAGFARALSQASGAPAAVRDDSFAEFSARTDLPEFDFIGLHGIWSWISDDNRRVIVEFVRRKLKVGGVLYVSYNTLPGWAAFAPLRHLMTQHADVMGAQGAGTVSRVNGAIDFASSLLEANPAYLKANPLVADRLKRLKDQSRNYLAHEYFNRDWHPMHFATMRDWLAPAKLTYACSANFLDHIDAINLTPEHQALLKQVPDATLRESTRDFLVNQQFRRDYWVRGARALSPLEQVQGQRAQRVVLTAQRAHVPTKVSGALGEANLSAEIYGPVLDLLASGQPMTLGEIERGISGRKISFAQLVQAVMILSGAGHLAPAQTDEAVAAARECITRLNTHLVGKAHAGGETTYLASAVTGGGIAVDRFQQLFLEAACAGKQRPAEWAKHAWDSLSAQGQRLLKEGKPLETAKANLAELEAQATRFGDKLLPVLRTLGVGLA